MHVTWNEALLWLVVFWARVRVGVPAAAAVAVMGMVALPAYVLEFAGVMVRFVVAPSTHNVASFMYRDIVAAVFSG